MPNTDIDDHGEDTNPLKTGSRIWLPHALQRQGEELLRLMKHSTITCEVHTEKCASRIEELLRRVAAQCHIAPHSRADCRLGDRKEVEVRGVTEVPSCVASIDHEANALVWEE